MASKFKKYNLDKKVDDFIREYAQNVKRENVGTDIGKFYFPRSLRDFIESKAVYTELRWSRVYSKQETEETQQIFTWEQFKRLTLPNFPTLDLISRDIDQQVLHRVIERGGNRTGSRRGVLFAQEFELDINVPVSYAIDWSDPNLYDFLEPLLPHLNLDTICPIDYFSRTSDNQILIPSMKLEDVISKLVVKKLRINAA